MKKTLAALVLATSVGCTTRNEIIPINIVEGQVIKTYTRNSEVLVHSPLPWREDYREPKITHGIIVRSDDIYGCKDYRIEFAPDLSQEEIDEYPVGRWVKFPTGKKIIPDKNYTNLNGKEIEVLDITPYPRQ